MLNTRRILALLLCLSLSLSAMAWAEEADIVAEESAEVAIEESFPLEDAPVEELGEVELAAVIEEAAQPEAAALSNEAQANDGELAIDEAHFPDKAFREWFVSEYDTDGNGSLSDAERAAVEIIYCDISPIFSLQGIEYFTELKSLYCFGDELTDLDLSRNTKLEQLDCSSNDLTSLDLSRNKKLEGLTCYDNKLTSLDVSGNTNLTYLACYDNALESLNVSGCKKLEGLHCYNNKLATLDVSKNTKLTNLNCARNDLTTLDVSKNKKLERLGCDNNKLKSLDISKCPSLVKGLKSGKRYRLKKFGIVKLIYEYEKGKSYFSLSVDPKLTIGTKALKKVSITKGAKATLKKGKTLKLKVKLTPKDAAPVLTWSSSNEKVAKVSAAGKVTALKKGKAKITVKAANGKKATIKITVK